MIRRPGSKLLGLRASGTLLQHYWNSPAISMIVKLLLLCLWLLLCEYCRSWGEGWWWGHVVQCTFSPLRSLCHSLALAKLAAHCATKPRAKAQAFYDQPFSFQRTRGVRNMVVVRKNPRKPTNQILLKGSQKWLLSVWLLGKRSLFDVRGDLVFYTGLNHCGNMH